MGGSQPLEAVDACRPLCHVERTRVGAGGSWRNQGLNSALLLEPQLSPEDLREIDRACPEPGMGCPSPHLSLTRRMSWWKWSTCSKVALSVTKKTMGKPSPVRMYCSGEALNSSCWPCPEHPRWHTDCRYLYVSGKSLGWWGCSQAQRSSGKAEW